MKTQARGIIYQEPCNSDKECQAGCRNPNCGCSVICMDQVCQCPHEFITYVVKPPHKVPPPYQAPPPHHTKPPHHVKPPHHHPRHPPKHQTPPPHHAISPSSN